MQCLFSVMFSILLNQREKVLSCLATECVGVFLQHSIMGDKKIKQSKANNNRRWTDLELDCFAKESKDLINGGEGWGGGVLIKSRGQVILEFQISGGFAFSVLDIITSTV